MSVTEFRSAHRPTLAQRIALWREQIRIARRRRAVYRQTHWELSQLSDRELSDLGLSRGRIGAIAREAAQSA